MLQFGVAPFVMLLAMHYNGRWIFILHPGRTNPSIFHPGYIIVCILIGAFLDSFIFSWDQLLNEIK